MQSLDEFRIVVNATFGGQREETDRQIGERPGALRGSTRTRCPPVLAGVKHPDVADLRRSQDRFCLQADLRRRGAQAPAHRAPEPPPRARRPAPHSRRAAPVERAARRRGRAQALDRGRQVHRRVRPAVRRRDAGAQGRRVREARRLQREQGLCHAAAQRRGVPDAVRCRRSDHLQFQPLAGEARGWALQGSHAQPLEDAGAAQRREGHAASAVCVSGAAQVRRRRQPGDARRQVGLSFPGSQESERGSQGPLRGAFPRCAGDRAHRDVRSRGVGGLRASQDG